MLLDFLRDYQNPRLAFLIYPEVLANVKDLDKKEVTSFTTDNYDKHYSSLGRNKLDTQIASFYTNLKRYKPNYSSYDLDSLLDQGKAALKNLNY